MNSAHQSECIVTGTLCFVLRVSQIAGVAPLKFKRTRVRWCVRVSPVCNYYAHFMGFILCALSILSITMDICIEPERSFRIRTVATRSVWVADVGTVGLVVCAAVLTGLRRMRSLIEYLLQLQQINLKLSVYHKHQSNDRKRMLFVVASMCFTVCIILIDFSIFIYQVVTSNGKVITSCMYIFYNISSIVLQVILIQFSQIATSVFTPLQTVNSCLKDLLQDILKNTSESIKLVKLKESQENVSYKSINSVIDTMTAYKGTIKICPKTLPPTIRRLSLLYCSICDVVQQVNDSHGPVLVALMLALLLHLIITPYHVITDISNITSSDRSSPLLQINWFVLHFSNLLQIIEPCHRTHREMHMTKHLISQMMRFTPQENDVLLTELDIFYRHLMLNDVTYSPMMMFSLNRTLIVTILGSITTYLVIVVQL